MSRGSDKGVYVPRRAFRLAKDTALLSVRGEKRARVAASFWARVEQGPGCWLWRLRGDRDGYGQFGLRLGGRFYCFRAHRVAWLLTHGAIPDGLFLLHRCDTPACCRPDHLFLGTQADNLADARTKGRLPSRRRMYVQIPGRSPWLPEVVRNEVEIIALCVALGIIDPMGKDDQS
jgi:hypothetical protein